MDTDSGFTHNRCHSFEFEPQHLGFSEAKQPPTRQPHARSRDLALSRECETARTRGRENAMTRTRRQDSPHRKWDALRYRPRDLAITRDRDIATYGRASPRSRTDVARRTRRSSHKNRCELRTCPRALRALSRSPWACYALRHASSEQLSHAFPLIQLVVLEESQPLDSREKA